MMLRNEISENWDNDINGHLQRIKSVSEMYPAYTIKSDNEFGVAVPLDRDIDVNEDFSNAKIKTQRYFTNGESVSKTYLTLTTGDSTNKSLFSALCEQFVFPGDHGEFREEIVASPIKWWMEMKRIFGNKNVEDMIYDTLGELWTYDHLLRSGRSVTWIGPQGSSTDIESDDMLIEVKSTLSRSKKEITVHGKTQLTVPPNKRLFLYLCVFEMSVNTGYSINDIVYGLANDGYDTREINERLAQKGLEVGKSARDKKYILWNVYRYLVDENFPRITDESFANGREPDGITSISYTVDLGNIPCEIIVSGSE